MITPQYIHLIGSTWGSAVLKCYNSMCIVSVWDEAEGVNQRRLWMLGETTAVAATLSGNMNTHTYTLSTRSHTQISSVDKACGRERERYNWLLLYLSFL